MFSKRFLEKDRTVQERFFRLKFQKNFGYKLKNILLWRLHRKLNKEFLFFEKSINKAIETTVFEYRKIDESMFPASKPFFNIGLFFLLAARDVQALKADAFAHPNKTKRNVALRALLLTIYEWDMGKVTGRKMHFIYETTGLSDASKNGIVLALKELKKARKDVESQFSEARHNAIAHREANALRQYEIISDLEIMQFKVVLKKFFNASDLLLSSLVPAMLEIGSTKSLFNQLAKENAGA
jgi:hypothetical protein